MIVDAQRALICYVDWYDVNVILVLLLGEKNVRLQAGGGGGGGSEGP